MTTSRRRRVNITVVTDPERIAEALAPGNSEDSDVENSEEEDGGLFSILNQDGAFFLVTSNEYIIGALYDCLSREVAAAFMDGAAMAVPLAVLFNHLAALRLWGDQRQDDDIRHAIEQIAAIHCQSDPEIKARIAAGETTFGLLPLSLREGMIMTFGQGRHFVCGEVSGCEMIVDWKQMAIQVTLRVISTLGAVPCEATLAYDIPAFKGWRRHDALPLRVAGAAEIAQAAARGRRVLDCVGTGTPPSAYLRCQGSVMSYGLWNKTPHRADGRVMIDSATFRQIAPHLIQPIQDQTVTTLEETSLGGPVFARQEGAWRPALDSRLHLCLPWLYGFSFAAKKWGEFHVDDLAPISFRKDAFDKLVLDPEYKELILALLQNTQQSFGDLIEGKGGGCIFLLHGEPGLGKTLTAEAVAEILERPLYSISVGELGTSPSELEGKLRTILDVAAIWNAVILLDEADIFLEARDHHDVQRNAMVGVFLRLLEYHQGVLFLTTNRVQSFDKAFHSRISVALHYSALTGDSRTKVWTNLLQAAGITTVDPAAVAVHPLNGRQIKNIIRLAQALALSQGRSVLAADIDRMVALAEQFNLDAARH